MRNIRKTFSVRTEKLVLKILLDCKAKKIGKIPGRRDCPNSYYQNAKKLFGSWNNLVKECGYQPQNIRTVENLTKEKAQEIIRKKAKELGRIPRRYEINGDSIANAFGWNKIIAETFGMQFKSSISYRVTEMELLRDFRKNINKIFKKKKIKYINIVSYNTLRIKGTQCGSCILNHLNEVSWSNFYQKYVLDSESYILNFNYEYKYICNFLNKKVITSREYDRYQKNLSRRYLENKFNLTWYELIEKAGFKTIKRKYTKEEWIKLDNQILDLYNKYNNYTKVAKILNISYRTVHRRIQKIKGDNNY